MRQCEVIAVANQKGGVGKTTTTFSLGVALAKQGKKVLLIDADPQADLTACMGWYNQDEIPKTLASLMENTIQLKTQDNQKNYILNHKENIDLIPSNLDLAVVEAGLLNVNDREYIMKNSISSLKQDYDCIIIDCMPSLGMLTINALACADKVIIPVQAQYLAARNMGQLLRTVSKVRKYINPNLKVGGILLTLVDKRTNLSKDIIAQLHEDYEDKVNLYKSQIPISTKIAESTSVGESIFAYNKNVKVADAYFSFSKEVLKNAKEKNKNAIGYAR